MILHINTKDQNRYGIISIGMIKTVNNLVPKSRIPIAYLLDYIKEGLNISDFLSAYPWLKRKDVER